MGMLLCRECSFAGSRSAVDGNAPLPLHRLHTVGKSTSMRTGSSDAKQAFRA